MNLVPSLVTRVSHLPLDYIRYNYVSKPFAKSIREQRDQILTAAGSKDGFERLRKGDKRKLEKGQARWRRQPEILQLARERVQSRQFSQNIALIEEYLPGEKHHLLGNLLLMGAFGGEALGRRIVFFTDILAKSRHLPCLPERIRSLSHCVEDRAHFSAYLLEHSVFEAWAGHPSVRNPQFQTILDGREIDLLLDTLEGRRILIEVKLKPGTKSSKQARAQRALARRYNADLMYVRGFQSDEPVSGQSLTLSGLERFLDNSIDYIIRHT